MKEKFTHFRRAAFLLLLAVTFGTLPVQAQKIIAKESKVSAISKDIGFTARKYQKSDPKASKIAARPTPEHRAKARAVRKAPDNATFFEDFEGITTDGQLPEGWTTIDADGDGFNWSSHVNTGTQNHTAHSGDVSLYSESYDNVSEMALTPDNWLITPKVALGGTLKVWAIGQDPTWCEEHFAFYVSVAGNTDVDDFVRIAPASGEFVATGDYVEYIADLSAFAGQEGYIAIRHFNVSDEFILVIDDFAIVDEVAPVTNLQVADVTSSQATVSWSGTYDSFNVRYRTAYDTRATYFQDFEGDLEGWASYTENEGDGWELGNWGEEYGIVAYSESYSSSTGALDVDNWLISPKLALGGTLKFSEYVSSSWPDSYEVLLSTTTDEKESFTITLREMAEGAGDWNEVSIDLSAYEGQEGYIAIHHVSYDCYYLIIDNFGIYGEATPAGEWVETTTTENSLVLTGLNPETTYDVQVQGVTGETPMSWTDAVQFTTLESSTSAPTNVTVTDITADGATISWQGEADAFIVRYRSGEGEWTQTSTTEKSIALTGLETNVQYEVQVLAVYGETPSDWTEPVTFTTLKIFPKPTDLVSEYITYNSAKLTWKANGDEIGWQIYVITTQEVDPSELEGLLVSVDEPEYIATNLEEYTNYYVFLRAVYEDGASDFVTRSFKTKEQFPKPNTFYYYGETTFRSFGLEWNEGTNATGYEYIILTERLDLDIDEIDASLAVSTDEPYFYFTDAEPFTDYFIYVRTLYVGGVSRWAYVSLGTPHVPTPTNVAVSDIDSESAVVTWTGDEAIEQYKLRYRTKGVDPSGEETVAFSENFDGLSAGSLPEGWTAIDADEDGYNWGASGDGTMVSDSYKNGVALSPDNWLITPKVQLDGLLKFKALNAANTYPDMMAVYVSTTGTDVEDFVEVLEPITPPTSWTEYTVDLRSFAGQEGYVAFRHSFVTDQLHIYIDDVSIVTYENSGKPAGEWVEVDASETTAELTELEAETDYEVQVQGIYHEHTSEWSPIVSFTTGDFFSLPTQVAVSDITADAATVNWKNSKAENYFVQYRVAGEDPTVLFEDFEGIIPEGDDYTYDLPEGWTTIDADGDGQSWYIYNGEERAHSGIAVATSASYLGEPLTPDNWLITPKVPLEGTLHAWFRGQDPDWSSEPYAIYVSTTGTEIADFTEVLPRTVATAEYVEQVVDLSEYAGQEGYVAFRHYDVTDQFRLNLDDVAIYKEVSENEWTYLYDYEEAPCTLTDLQPETKYEVRVGAIFYTREGEPIKIEGTNSVFFTTLAEGEVDAIADLAADVKSGRQDVYTLTGIRLNGMPTQRGFYIVNGKKVFVK